MAQVLNSVVDQDDILFDGRQQWQITWNLEDNLLNPDTFTQKGLNPEGEHVENLQDYADLTTTKNSVLARMARTERNEVFDASSGMTPAEVNNLCATPLWNTTEDMYRGAADIMMKPNVHPNVLLYFEEVYNHLDSLTPPKLAALLDIDTDQAAQFKAKTDKVFKTRYTYKEFVEAWGSPV